MEVFYITFGMNHRHKLESGEELNNETIGVLVAEDYKDAINKCEELFGRYFSFIYGEQEFDTDTEWLYSNGYVKIN